MSDGILTKVRRFLTKSPNVPASYVGGPVPPADWPMNWWQLGRNPASYDTRGGAVIESCVSAYAMTMAQLPGRHYRVDDQGVRSYVANSPITDIFHRPNDYQTWSDFLLNATYSLFLRGNAYMVMSEDKRSIYLLDARSTYAHRVSGTNDVFYSTTGLFADAAYRNSGVHIPERYVGHLRLHTPYDPLVGVTPIQAAAASVAANNAISNHQAAFFTNMSRPSGVLSTEMNLSKDQMIQLRTAWEDQSKNLNAGGVPILANGLKWDAMSISNQDAEMVAALKFTVEDISRVFHVPLMLINSMENATFNNAESLIRFWLTSGLGFLVNHVEQCLARLYRMPKNQGVELDTEVLLRADLQARMTAYGDAVTKGIYSPNEIRSREGLPNVEGGDMPRVQQQMVPLDWKQPTPAPAPSTTPTPPANVPEEDKQAFSETMFEDYLNFALDEEFDHAA